MAITIKDIARLAGTSVTATSLVLSDKWEKKVRKDLAKRIKRIARKHHYVCSPIGRGLALKRNYRISLCIHGRLTEYPVIGAFSFHELLLVVASELNKAGYGINIDQLTSPNRLKDIFAAGYDGILFIGWSESMLMLKRSLKKIRRPAPYVVVDTDLKDRTLNYSYTDMARSTEIAIDHLMQNGHQHIGFIRGERGRDRFRAKLKGYRKALDKHGILFNPAYVIDYGTDSNLVQQGYKRAEALFSMGKKPTAIFCSDNLLATGTLSFLKDRGLSVPRDIELIGFGDSIFADMARPPLSYMRRPVREEARACVRLLLQRIEDKDLRPKQLKFAEKLIIQGSCR